MNSLSYAGYIIALIGAILIIILSLLDIIGSPFLIFTPIVALGALARGIIGLLIGIICAVGARYVSHLGWALVLIILGIIAGGIGGVLVVVGALLGLLAHFIR